ncbi:MAG TPA: extracellular solute-binding protein, partial [Gammaproteobacteria bacterium]|nr:extracellular solute-binding protein [Gammaproteobacteria bacterium]
VDLIGMDVIWTAEFAAAGWIVPFGAEQAAKLQDRLAATLESASWDGQVWAAPFTTNAQLLWYRTDRVQEPPATWDDMLREAESLGADGTIEAQGARYEGLTVLFISLLRSAGGRVLDDSGRALSLAPEPTQRALKLLQRLAASPAAPANFSNAREDDSRLGFETGHASFMLNYTFVWPSAHENAPEVAQHMAWARWPRASADLPSRATLGGINVGVAARGKDPGLALRAALCLASPDNQRSAASLGALPPTIEALYDDPAVRAKLPFADALRATLRDAAQRPQTPLYSDVSLAISSALHPPRDIDPAATAARLRAAVGRALRSEGLL